MNRFPGGRWEIALGIPGNACVFLYIVLLEDQKVFTNKVRLFGFWKVGTFLPVFTTLWGCWKVKTAHNYDLVRASIRLEVRHLFLMVRVRS